VTHAEKLKELCAAVRAASYYASGANVNMRNLDEVDASLRRSIEHAEEALKILGELRAK